MIISLSNWTRKQPCCELHALSGLLQVVAGWESGGPAAQSWITVPAEPRTARTQGVEAARCQAALCVLWWRTSGVSGRLAGQTSCLSPSIPESWAEPCLSCCCPAGSWRPFGRCKRLQEFLERGCTRLEGWPHRGAC